MSDEMKNSSPPALGQVGGPVEFCRVDDLRRLFGIRRGSAYGLIREGKIRSISLRKPGHKNGVRLVHVASARAYLETLLREQE